MSQSFNTIGFHFGLVQNTFIKYYITVNFCQKKNHAVREKGLCEVHSTVEA